MPETFRKPLSPEEAHLQYLRNLFHDLRGPLASIQKSAEIAAGDLGRTPESEIRELLVIIKGESERLLEFLTLKLEAEAFDRGTVSLNKSAFEISKFLAAIAATLQEEFSEKNCRADFYDPGTPLWVEADKIKMARLFQILGKLLAVRGGALALEVKENKGPRSVRIAIRVLDPCPNPPEADPPSLALQVARDILKLHGTTLEPEGPMRGSEFHFSLARLPESTKTPDPQNLRGAEPDGKKP